VPVALALALFNHAKTQVKWPWFILLFCLAAVANSYVPAFAAVYPKLSGLGKTGLTVTLFLIGTSISPATLKQVGVRPLVQGIVLWAIVASLSLLLIRFGYLSV
jgi:uncharacterized membrane protein YadS